MEADIGNDRSNLQVAELTDSGLLSRLEYTLNYDAKETARRRYLDTVDFEPQAFSCHYDPDHWKEDSLLSYIADPEGSPLKIIFKFYWPGLFPGFIQYVSGVGNAKDFLRRIVRAPSKKLLKLPAVCRHNAP